ncbi:porin family protein [Bdellovibrio sp. HCB117]|uniref:porin family protein n=1 Tax=Bdellovibrio TaxID=958 RepID=UPI000A5A8E3E|nr:porin family protein [Bdellovibrio bacteriovorus]
MIHNAKDVIDPSRSSSDKDSVKKIVLLLIFLVSTSASAGTLVELGGTYMSDNLSTSEAKKSSKYFYNVGVLFSLKKHIWGGWNYSGISHTDSGDEELSFASQDTGPYLKWQFGRNELYSLGAAYNILSRASYKSGSDTETWQGTSFWLQFAVAPEVREGFHIGASLNYYLASYTKKTVDNVESSTSNSKSWIFPMLMLTKEW